MQKNVQGVGDLELFLENEKGNQLLKEIQNLNNENQLSSWKSIYYMVSIVIFIWLCDLIRMFMWFYQKMKLKKTVAFSLAKKSP